MNKNLYLLPISFTSIIITIAMAFVFPESAYAIYMKDVFYGLTDVFSYIGYGLSFSLFLVFGPLLIVIWIKYALFSLTGYSIDRWSPDTPMHYLLQKCKKLRNSFHLIGFMLVIFAYALFFRHMEEESIKISSTATFCIFSLAEFLYTAFTLNVAILAKSAAKKDLPLNKGFKIVTTKDQCWIESKAGNQKFRTVLINDDELNWVVKSSYKVTD